MKLEPKMDTYCEALMGATKFARVAGVDSVNVINGLVGTVVLSIKAGGGDNGDVADVFRTFADCYDEQASGQHCTALREASLG